MGSDTERRTVEIPTWDPNTETEYVAVYNEEDVLSGRVDHVRWESVYECAERRLGWLLGDAGRLIVREAGQRQQDWETTELYLRMVDDGSEPFDVRRPPEGGPDVQ